MTTATDALQAIAEALSRELDFMLEDPTVRAEAVDPRGVARGRRPPPDMVETARVLGASGLIVRLHLQGWSAALASKLASIDLVVDLDEDPDRVVAAACRQMAWHVEGERHMNGLAVEAGFTGFPSLRDYADPRWLKVDSGVWEAFTGIVGGRNAGAWVRDALTLIYEREADHGRRVRAPADVFYGQFRPYLVTGPVRLGTWRTVNRPSSWLGTRIVLPQPWTGPVPSVGDTVRDLMPGMPDGIGDRRVARAIGVGDEGLDGVLAGLLPMSFDYEPDLLPLAELL